jgi:hypothetical protein
MYRRSTLFFGLAALGLVLAGCRSAETVSPGAVPIPTAAVVPEGTHLALRLELALGLGISGAGNPFRATVASLVVTEGGGLVVPAGTEVFGTVTGVAPPGDGHPAAIRLAFDRIGLAGEDYPLRAAVVETDVEAEGGAAARGRVLSGAALDALVGALGAGPGTVLSLGTDPEQATLPVGTLLVVATEQPIPLR